MSPALATIEEEVGTDSAVDALAGGYLAENFGFGSVFWAMAGVAGVAALLIIFLAPESTANSTGRMDWLGVLPLVVSVERRLSRSTNSVNWTRRTSGWWPPHSYDDELPGAYS